MSREAFGDQPESQDPPDLCPVCGNDWHAEDCEFGKEVARRLKAERDAHRLAHALKNVAMMLRKCAHRLRCNGHEDLSADAVGLLRRLGLLGSPLRREFECLGEPNLCTNPRGCACLPDSKTPNVGGEARIAAHQPSQTTTATPQGVASTDQLGGRVRSEKDSA